MSDRIKEISEALRDYGQLGASAAEELLAADVIESESGPHDWCRGHKSKEYEDRQ